MVRYTVDKTHRWKRHLLSFITPFFVKAKTSLIYKNLRILSILQAAQ